jgi:hypothetical protein
VGDVDLAAGGRALDARAEAVALAGGVQAVEHRPMVLRIMSCGSLARFSAQLVSITPASASSTVEREAALLPEAAQLRPQLFGRQGTTQPALLPVAHDAWRASRQRRTPARGGGAAVGVPQLRRRWR